MAPRKATFYKPSGSAVSSRRLAPNLITGRKAANRKGRLMKGIFKGKVMSLVGDFSHLDKPVAHEDAIRWITSHGGTFEREVSADTTHLICSIAEYKKKHEQVQKAWVLGKQKCAIVTIEWLTDCLSLGAKKKSRSTRGYTLDRTLIRLKNGKADNATYKEKFEQGVQASKELCDNKLYHVYYDAEGFEYKVILTRVNLGGRVMTEKYTLYLFESHAIPHIYLTGAKFSRNNRPTAYYREQCRPMIFKDAFKHFKHFFKEKTGIDWDKRLEPKPAFPGGAGKSNGKGKGKGKERENAWLEQWKQGGNPKDANLEDELDRRFDYLPPPLGRPVGLLPLGYIRPEQREETSASIESEEATSDDEDEDSGVVYDTDSDVDGAEEDDFLPTSAAINKPKSRSSTSKLVSLGFNTSNVRLSASSGSTASSSSGAGNSTSSSSSSSFSTMYYDFSQSQTSGSGSGSGSASTSFSRQDSASGSSKESHIDQSDDQTNVKAAAKDTELIVLDG